MTNSEAADTPGKRSDSIPDRLNLFLLSAAVLIAVALLFIASHVTSWHWLLAAAFAFSFINNTIFALLHESVHSKFHANRAVNEWCGRLAASFFPTSLSMQRAFHLGHHRRNRTEVERFDYIGPGDNKFLKIAQWYSILTGLYWVSAPIGCLTYLIAPWVLRLSAFRSKNSALGRQTSTNAMIGDLDGVSGRTARSEILLTIAIQLALVFFLDLNFVGWTACYAAFAVNWSSLQYADHAWSRLDVRNGAWNLRVNRLVQFLFLNYHHHLAHHQHPEVAWIHLHRFVDFSAYRPRFLSVYLSMWRGPRLLPDPQIAGTQLNSIQAAQFGGLGRFGATQSDLHPHQIGAQCGQDSSQATPLRPSEWREQLLICALFTAFFCAVYGTTDFLTGLHSFRIPIHFEFELKLPFIPELTIVYSSLYLLMGTAVFVFRPWQELLRLALTLGLATLCAAVSFVLFPIEQVFVHESPSGFIGMLFRVADIVNLEHNMFPSLHVAFGWIVALALRAKVSTLAGLSLFGWAAMLSVSAVLTQQHYVLDIVGGVVLAVFAMKVIYPHVTHLSPVALARSRTNV